MENVVDVAATQASGASIAYAGTTVSAGTKALIHAGAGALSGGINAAMTGGDVGREALIGMGIAGVAALANVAYTEMAGFKPTLAPGEKLADGTYDPYALGQQAPKNGAVFGENKPLTGNFWKDFWKQGGFIGKVGNLFPGGNAIAGLHDYWMNTAAANGTFNTITNVATMLPAAALSYAGQLDAQLMPLTVQMSNAESRRKKD